MPKKPISLTLDQTNLVWLRGRAQLMTGGSISEALDQLVLEARLGRLGAAQPSRSVAGTIDLGDDQDLKGADRAIRELFSSSLERPLGAEDGAATRTRRKKSVA